MPASAPIAVSSCRRIAWWAEKTERYSTTSTDGQWLGMSRGVYVHMGRMHVFGN